MADVHALPVHCSFTQFSSDGLRDVLCPNAADLSKVIPAAYVSMECTFQIFNLKCSDYLFYLINLMYKPHLLGAYNATNAHNTYCT